MQPFGSVKPLQCEYRPLCEYMHIEHWANVLYSKEFVNTGRMWAMCSCACFRRRSANGTSDAAVQTSIEAPVQAPVEVVVDEPTPEPMEQPPPDLPQPSPTRRESQVWETMRRFSRRTSPARSRERRRLLLGSFASIPMDNLTVSESDDHASPRRSRQQFC